MSLPQNKMTRLGWKDVSSAIGLPFLLLGAFWGWILIKRPGSPLSKYGVRVEWKVGGATNSYPWIEVWYEDETRRIDCPAIFGGIADPELSYKDIDGDQIPEIHFSDDRFEQIVGFKPGLAGVRPRWIIHKNNAPPGKED